MEWHFLGNFVLGIFNAVACNHVWISIGGGLIFSAKNFLSLFFSISLFLFLSLHTHIHSSFFLSSFPLLRYIFRIYFFPLYKIYFTNSQSKFFCINIHNCKCLTFYYLPFYYIPFYSYYLLLYTLSSTKVHGIVKRLLQL